MAHVVALHGLHSFAEITPSIAETIAEDAAYGIDGLLRVSPRLQFHLLNLSTSGRLDDFRDRRLRIGVDRAGLLTACGLDPSILTGSRSAVEALRQIKDVEGRLVLVPEPQSPLARITGISMYRYLVGLSSIYQMRDRMKAASIGFDPFPEGFKFAYRTGTATKRTPVPSPKIVSSILEESIIWVTDYAPLLLRAIANIRAAPTSRRGVVRDAELQKLPISVVPGSLWPLPTEGNRASIALREAVGLLATACWVIIATFSAARATGIANLRADCIAGDDVSGWWISIFIAKTLRRNDWLPVPRLVFEAVEVLRALSGTDPATRGPLFILPPGDRGGGTIMRPKLKAFAALVGATKDEDGRAWSLSPHQFRAFFATYYFWRYGDARIEALSHHLRHFSVETTRQYLTQERGGARIWAEVERDFVGGIAKDIVAGKHWIGGSVGEHFKKVARRATAHFRKRLIVVSPDELASALVSRMLRKGLVFTPTAWGHICTCGRTRAAAAKAKCREANELAPEDVGPDLAYAGATVCASCPHAMKYGPSGTMVSTEFSHLQRVDSTRPRDGSLFGELERNRLVTFQRQYSELLEGDEEDVAT